MRNLHDLQTGTTIAEWLIEASTTFGSADGQFFVSNSSPGPVKVTVQRLIEPPPPPRCADVLGDDDYECTRYTCQLPPGHESYHQETVDDRVVLWRDVQH